MRVVQISDTHSKHRDLPMLPEGDVLVHCGDFTACGFDEEALDFLNWFIDLPYKHKIFVTGNHDQCLWDAESIEDLPNNVHFLQDRGVTIDGVKFFGIGFNHPESAIPLGTDVVVTHEPPMDILDQTGDKKWGLFFLWKRIQEVRPKYHLFGHAHSASGVLEKDGIIFSNASVMDDDCRLAYPPKVFDI